MKKAIMLKTKRYKFGLTLNKGEKVFISDKGTTTDVIDEKDDKFFAYKTDNGVYSSLSFGVKRSDFRYEDELEVKPKAKKKFVYTSHCNDYAEGHIFINKGGACTITLTGAVAMTQDELDKWGQKIVELLNKEVA